MSVHVGQLKIVKPKTLIKGFSVEIKLIPTSIVAEWVYETLVIDYYFEVTVFCDGTHADYKIPEYFTVQVSQLIDTCDHEFVSNCPVLMLKKNEQLTEISVQHGEMENLCGVWLVFRVQDCDTDEVTVRGYLFRPD